VLKNGSIVLIVLKNLYISYRRLKWEHPSHPSLTVGCPPAGDDSGPSQESRAERHLAFLVPVKAETDLRWSAAPGAALGARNVVLCVRAEPLNSRPCKGPCTIGSRSSLADPRLLDTRTDRQMVGHRERLIDGDEFDALTRNGRRAHRFRSRERRIVKRKVAKRARQVGKGLARAHV
jgi:hypothetical protein